MPLKACKFCIYIITHKSQTECNTTLEPFLGSRARVAEVLNRVRPLSLEMIRRLSTGLGIPAEVLIQPYDVTRAA